MNDEKPAFAILQSYVKNAFVGDAMLRDILIIFAVAIPVVLIAHRLRFPSIVGFLITGFIIGPNMLRFVADVEEMRVLAELGVALLLFSIGLEFTFERLKGWGRTIFGIGSIQVFVTAAIGFAVGLAQGFSKSESAFLGCTIALSSTAIVLAVLSHKRWFDAPAGRITTGILILQDLAVIPMMVLLKVFAMNKFEGFTRDFAFAGLKLLFLGTAIFVLAKWVIRPLLHHTSVLRSKELFVIVVVGVAIAASYATERLGFSFALGAFLAGLLVSATDFRFHALSEIAPFRHCFNGLFFVAAGMIVDPVFIANNLADVLLLVSFIILIKIVVTGGLVLLFSYPLSVAVICALMLAQVGEFSFMLVFFGWKAGAINFYLYQLVVSSAAITMIIAPFLVAIAPGIGERLSFVTWRFRSLRGRGMDAAPEEIEELANHSIICGFGPLGMTVGKLMEKHGMKYVVLELNPVTASRYKQAGKIVYVGDGASSALLHHSGINRARLLAIAVPDHLNAIAIITQARIMNKDIYIITRSRYRNQVQDLYDAGADVVVCEELEGGIEMGRYILQELGVDKNEITRMFCEVRSFGSADFF